MHHAWHGKLGVWRSVGMAVGTCPSKVSRYVRLCVLCFGRVSTWGGYGLKNKTKKNASSHNFLLSLSLSLSVFQGFIDFIVSPTLAVLGDVLEAILRGLDPGKKKTSELYAVHIPSHTHTRTPTGLSRVRFRHVFRT